MTGEMNAYRPGLLAPQSRTSRKYIVVEINAPGSANTATPETLAIPNGSDIAAQAPGSNRSEASSRTMPPIMSVRPASCTAPKCRIIGCVMTDPGRVAKTADGDAERSADLATNATSRRRRRVRTRCKRRSRPTPKRRSGVS